MSSTAVKLGKDAKLFRNTGSYGTPTWDEIDNVNDLTLNIELDEADSSIRGFGGYATAEPTLMVNSLEWGMNHDPADTDWEAVRAAVFGRSALELLALNGANSAGSQGFRASFKFFKFGHGQPLRGIQQNSVMAKPCIAANAPSWHTVS